MQIDYIEQAPPVMKRGKFNEEEDKMLKELVKNNKNSSWKDIAANFPGRTAAQCRDRYNQYLFKEIVNTPWTPAEDSKIVSLYRQFGPRWVKIATFFPGRNGNSIKNRWNSALKQYHGISYKRCKQERRSKKDKWEDLAENEPPIVEEPKKKSPPPKLPSIIPTLQMLDNIPKSPCMPFNMFVPQVHCLL